jgi:CHAT domain-containing protein
VRTTSRSRGHLFFDEVELNAEQGSERERLSFIHLTTHASLLTMSDAVFVKVDVDKRLEAVELGDENRNANLVWFSAE